MTFTARDGDSPSKHFKELRKKTRVSIGDVLYGFERFRSRVIERTNSGLDYLERPFAKYSDKGPYYRKIGMAGYTAGQTKKSASQFAKKTGGTVSRTGMSVKFDSYADFKQSLGRSGVDLRGPRAPHMLDAILIKVNGKERNSYDSTEEAVGFVEIGIYGEEAARAKGHNEGVVKSHLPQRRFLDASQQDLQRLYTDIDSHRNERLKKG